MKKTSVLLFSAAIFLTVSAPLFAQGGCVNSPENPTAVLALVGSAGALCASARRRFRASRNLLKK